MAGEFMAIGWAMPVSTWELHLVERPRTMSAMSTALRAFPFPWVVQSLRP